MAFFGVVAHNYTSFRLSQAHASCKAVKFRLDSKMFIQVNLNMKIFVAHNVFMNIATHDLFKGFLSRKKNRMQRETTAWCQLHLM